MDAATKERLAAEAHAERKRRRWTIPEVAKRADVSAGTVGGFERGNSFPQVSNLRAILRTLDIDMPDDEPPSDEPPIVEDSRWSPDVRVALNVIGLYLEKFNPVDRERHIDDIVRAIIADRL